VLAQLTAGSFGTGWAYYAASIAVTVVLALAANTSFGGPPALMSLLSDDDRLPAEPAGAAPGHRPACQHRRRHLHHPLPAHQPLTPGQVPDSRAWPPDQDEVA